MTDILYSFWHLVPVTLVQSLMYATVAFGIMIPFRILSLPDLTCEGSLPLGGCLTAALLATGFNPYGATLLAVLAGALAGATTAWLHLRFRIHSLLAGILVFTMLWSVNLRVLGKPNAPLPGEANVFDALSPEILMSDWLQVGMLGALAVAGTLALIWLFRTEIGLSMRCVGVNERLAPALAIRSAVYIVGGFALANAIVAFGGALLVQQQGYADVTMGFGVLINGLAALIVGEAIVGRHTVVRQMCAPLVGAIVYYQLVSLGLATGLHPSDLKFLTGLFVIATLALPRLLRRGEGNALGL
ncbi:ABC transporter permease subunit [Pusillimonas sp.]|uniref:ABC transporter permease n=1 Tax=Pusillimonas sp. TaxID=3040095 RepID=UPI0029A774F8|nr:ABC transporter permease [Pusillimonas sp.]MDX3895187.1 ABC transporter permease [Pusillimonas sp.]